MATQLDQEFGFEPAKKSVDEDFGFEAAKDIDQEFDFQPAKEKASFDVAPLNPETLTVQNKPKHPETFMGPLPPKAGVEAAAQPIKLAPHRSEVPTAERVLGAGMQGIAKGVTFGAYKPTTERTTAENIAETVGELGGSIPAYGFGGQVVKPIFGAARKAPVVGKWLTNLDNLSKVREAVKAGEKAAPASAQIAAKTLQNLATKYPEFQKTLEYVLEHPKLIDFIVTPALQGAEAGTVMAGAGTISAIADGKSPKDAIIHGYSVAMLGEMMRMAPIIRSLGDKFKIDINNTKLSDVMQYLGKRLPENEAEYQAFKAFLNEYAARPQQYAIGSALQAATGYGVASAGITAVMTPGDIADRLKAGGESGIQTFFAIGAMHLPGVISALSARRGGGPIDPADAAIDYANMSAKERSQLVSSIDPKDLVTAADSINAMTSAPQAPGAPTPEAPRPQPKGGPIQSIRNLFGLDKREGKKLASDLETGLNSRKLDAESLTNIVSIINDDQAPLSNEQRIRLFRIANQKAANIMPRGPLVTKVTPQGAAVQAQAPPKAQPTIRQQMNAPTQTVAPMTGNLEPGQPSPPIPAAPVPPPQRPANRLAPFPSTPPVPYEQTIQKPTPGAIPSLPINPPIPTTQTPTGNRLAIDYSAPATNSQRTVINAIAQDRGIPAPVIMQIAGKPLTSLTVGDAQALMQRMKTITAEEIKNLPPVQVQAGAQPPTWEESVQKPTAAVEPNLPIYPAPPQTPVRPMVRPVPPRPVPVAPPAPKPQPLPVPVPAPVAKPAAPAPTPVQPVTPPVPFRLGDKVTTPKGNGAIVGIKGNQADVRVKQDIITFPLEKIAAQKKTGIFKIDPAKNLINAVRYVGGINPEIVKKEGLWGEWERIPKSVRMQIGRKNAKGSIAEVAEQVAQHGYDVDGGTLLYSLSDDKIARKGTAAAETEGTEFAQLEAAYKGQQKELEDKEKELEELRKLRAEWEKSYGKPGKKISSETMSDEDLENEIFGDAPDAVKEVVGIYKSKGESRKDRLEKIREGLLWLRDSRQMWEQGVHARYGYPDYTGMEGDLDKIDAEKARWIQSLPSADQKLWKQLDNYYAELRSELDELEEPAKIVQGPWEPERVEETAGAYAPPRMGYKEGQIEKALLKSVGTRTELRDLDGSAWLMPSGHVIKVENHFADLAEALGVYRRTIPRIVEANGLIRVFRDPSYFYIESFSDNASPFQLRQLRNFRYQNPNLQLWWEDRAAVNAGRKVAEGSTYGKDWDTILGRLETRPEAVEEQGGRYGEPKHGTLWLNGWAGVTSQEIEIVGETPTKLRIRAIKRTKLGGRDRWLEAGKETTVPKSAVKIGEKWADESVEEQRGLYQQSQKGLFAEPTEQAPAERKPVGKMTPEEANRQFQAERQRRQAQQSSMFGGEALIGAKVQPELRAPFTPEEEARNEKKRKVSELQWKANEPVRKAENKLRAEQNKYDKFRKQLEKDRGKFGYGADLGHYDIIDKLPFHEKIQLRELKENVSNAEIRLRHAKEARNKQFDAIKKDYPFETREIPGEPPDIANMPDEKRALYYRRMVLAKFPQEDEWFNKILHSDSRKYFETPRAQAYYWRSKAFEKGLLESSQSVSTPIEPSKPVASQPKEQAKLIPQKGETKEDQIRRGIKAEVINAMGRDYDTQYPDEIYLIACGSTKAKGEPPSRNGWPAKDLYQGDLFKKARAVAEKSGKPWLIMSAEHGLLNPEQMVQPYDKNLMDMKPEERKLWAERNASALEDFIDPNETKVIILGGKTYRDAMVPELDKIQANVETPLIGKGIGQQKAALKKQLEEKVAVAPSKPEQQVSPKQAQQRAEELDQQMKEEKPEVSNEEFSGLVHQWQQAVGQMATGRDLPAQKIKDFLGRYSKDLTIAKLMDAGVINLEGDRISASQRTLHTLPDSESPLSKKEFEAIQYPFPAEFDGEKVTILGPADSFEPYKSDMERRGGKGDPYQLMVQRKDGSKFITFATGLKRLDGRRLVARPQGKVGPSSFETWLDKQVAGELPGQPLQSVESLAGQTAQIEVDRRAQNVRETVMRVINGKGTWGDKRHQLGLKSWNDYGEWQPNVPISKPEIEKIIQTELADTVAQTGLQPTISAKEKPIEWMLDWDKESGRDASVARVGDLTAYVYGQDGGSRSWKVVNEKTGQVLYESPDLKNYGRAKEEAEAFLRKPQPQAKKSEVASLFDKMENEYTEEPSAAYEPERTRKQLLQHIEVRDDIQGEAVSSGKLWNRSKPEFGPSLLGLSITPALQKGEWVDVRGKRIRGVKDLVAIGRLYRNPQIEMLHLLAVKDGKVTAHQAVSSRLPTSSLIGTEKTYARNLFEYRKWAERTEADAVFVLHNHPSGDVKASGADKKVTQDFARAIPQFGGHVIIDHETYTWLDPFGEADEYQKLPNEVPDLIHEPLVPHPGLKEKITSPDKLAAFGKKYIQPNPNNVTLIWRSQNEVRAIENVPLDVFMDREKFTPWLRGSARNYGGMDVFAYYNNQDDRGRAFRVKRKMDEYTDAGSYKRGDLLLDGIVEGVGEPSRITAQPQDVNTFGLTRKQEVGQTRQLREEEGEYRGLHTAPGPESGAPLHDLTGGGTVYPDDVYGPNGLRYYGTGEGKADAESMWVIRFVHNKPNATVTVYRAVPKIETRSEVISRIEKEKAQFMRRGTIPKGSTITNGSKWYEQASAELDRLKAEADRPEIRKIGINQGDWVTLSRAYAKQHGESTLEGNYRILSKKVKANELYTNGDSINEFGYWPKGTSESVREEEGEYAKPAQTETPEFKKWFGDSKVVDSKGNPLVVYHGTTFSFEEFNQSKSNIESDFGKAFYFTNSPRDVENNYAGQGPDLTNRIERLAEQLILSEDYSQVDAYQKAKEELLGQSPNTMPVYLSLKNPAILGGKNETVLTYQVSENEEGDITGESGTLIDFIESLRSAASNFDDVKIEATIAYLLEESGYEDIKLSDALKALKKSEDLIYATDENGDLASNELIRQALEEYGFDGVIDRTVNTKFGSQRDMGRPMKGMNTRTVHYVAFSPTQIKSAIGNRGTFDPNDPNILREEPGEYGMASKDDAFADNPAWKEQYERVKEMIASEKGIKRLKLKLGESALPGEKNHAVLFWSSPANVLDRMGGKYAEIAKLITEADAAKHAAQLPGHFYGMQHFDDLANHIVKEEKIKRNSEEDHMVRDLLDEAFTGLTPEKLRQSPAYTGDKEAAIRAADRFRKEVFDPIINHIRGDEELRNIIGKKGYIRGYFPHFLTQMESKFGKAEALKMVKALLPERFVSKFLEQRESDVWPSGVSIYDVVPSYISSTAKTIHDIPAYDKARKLVNELSETEKSWGGEGTKNFAEWYISNYMGMPSKILGVFDPHAYLMRLSGKLAGLYYDNLIGLNWRTYLVNTFQTVSNTVPEIGFENTVKAINQLITSPAARKKFHDSGLLLDMPGIDLGVPMKTRARKFIHAGMAATEYLNRGIAYLGGIIQANKQGLIGKAAELHAINVVDKTQFAYGPKGQSRILSALPPDIRVFQTFRSKEAEFLRNLIADSYNEIKDKGSAGPDTGKLARFIMINGVLSAALTAIGIDVGRWFIELWDLIPGIKFRSIQLGEKAYDWSQAAYRGIGQEIFHKKYPKGTRIVKWENIPADVVYGMYDAFFPGANALKQAARDTGIVKPKRR